MLASDVEIDREEVVDLAHKGMLSALYARIKPGATAIHAPRGNRTYKQLHENANRLAAACAGRACSRATTWRCSAPTPPSSSR